MQVFKFGGTSVGTPERMKDVCKLITDDGTPKIVVLSAMSGTTNSLVEIADYVRKGNPEGAGIIITHLRRKYRAHIPELYATEEMRQCTRQLIDNIFLDIHDLCSLKFSDSIEKEILSKGELISTNMVTNRERLLSIVRVAITAGTLHPKAMISGINDLPWSPILCINLSMIKAARDIYPESSIREMKA